MKRRRSPLFSVRDCLRESARPPRRHRRNAVDAALDASTRRSGWKLVHADVLRPPQLPLLLAASVGTGMQLLCMSFIAIAGAMLGFLSPANRGGLLTATLLLFVLMGALAGFVSAWMYKTFKGVDWKLTTLKTALMYPGITFLLFFTLNLFVWGEKSSGAVPFGTMFALLLMWFCVS